jgi:hypothetical protein
VTPNPPDTDPDRAATDLEHLKMQEAADRAFNFYFTSDTFKEALATRKPNNIFLINPAVDDETLLVEACETLSLATDMVRHIADLMDGPLRKKLLMMLQVVTLSELVVNRVLDNQRLPG